MSYSGLSSVALPIVNVRRAVFAERSRSAGTEKVHGQSGASDYAAPDSLTHGPQYERKLRQMATRTSR